MLCGNAYLGRQNRAKCRLLAVLSAVTTGTIKVQLFIFTDSLKILTAEGCGLLLFAARIKMVHRGSQVMETVYALCTSCLAPSPMFPLILITSLLLKPVVTKVVLMSVALARLWQGCNVARWQLKPAETALAEAEAMEKQRKRLLSAVMHDHGSLTRHDSERQEELIVKSPGLSELMCTCRHDYIISAEIGVFRIVMLTLSLLTIVIILL